MPLLLHLSVRYLRRSLSQILRGNGSECARAFLNSVVVLSHLTDTIRGPEVQCPLCGWKGLQFMPKIQEGWRLKKGHTCPKCLSDIRYRTYCVAIREELTPTTESQNILEIASAEGSPLLFSHLPNKLFVSADINNRTAHVSMDVRNLPFQDSSIDFVLCSHVLEHVKEDVVAMKEFFRVLRRGKKSLIQVPIDATLAQTIEYEKPNPKESGHVRMYGMDYEHRLREAGFTVYPKRVWKDAREMEYFGGRDEVLYFAHKD